MHFVTPMRRLAGTPDPGPPPISLKDLASIMWALGRPSVAGTGQLIHSVAMAGEGEIMHFS